MTDKRPMNLYRRLVRLEQLQRQLSPPPRYVVRIDRGSDRFEKRHDGWTFTLHFTDMKDPDSTRE